MLGQERSSAGADEGLKGRVFLDRRIGFDAVHLARGGVGLAKLVDQPAACEGHDSASCASPLGQRLDGLGVQMPLADVNDPVILREAFDHVFLAEEVDRHLGMA